MELKNAIAVCLITLFSATLVLLIARALDLQAAPRLELQLAKIVDELEAIRKSGGIMAGSGVAAENESADDAVMVYYFHSNVRCPTCRAIESQAHETVQSEFASEMESGEVIWKVLNYEEAAGTELGKKFEIQMPVVVLARMNGGEIEQWKRLDEIWALVGDKPAFSDYVGDEISQMLEPRDTKPPVAPTSDAAEIPFAGVDPPDIPVPQSVDELNPLRGQEEIARMLETADGQPTPNGNRPALSLPILDSADIPIPTDPADIPVPQ